jgi:hypothetical protein
MMTNPPAFAQLRPRPTSTYKRQCASEISSKKLHTKMPITSVT